MCVCVWGACDTDKRPRRVHVSRMLPGEEEGERGAVFHFMLPVDVTLYPRPGSAGHDGGALPVDFMGLLLAVEWHALKQ